VALSQEFVNLTGKIPITLLTDSNQIVLYEFCERKFLNYDKEIEKLKVEHKFCKVIEQINTFVYYVPFNAFKVLPRGGFGYLKMLDKYKG